MWDTIISNVGQNIPVQNIPCHFLPPGQNIPHWFATPDKTSHAVFWHSGKTSHAIFVTLDKISHVISATLGHLYVKYLTDRSKAVLFCGFFMLFLSCGCYAFVRVCYVPCGHLLGKGWPLGSRLWCLTVRLSFSHWYPVSGAVLDCIDSWSLHLYLFIWYKFNRINRRPTKRSNS